MSFLPIPFATALYNVRVPTQVHENGRVAATAVELSYVFCVCGSGAYCVLRALLYRCIIPVVQYIEHICRRQLPLHHLQDKWRVGVQVRAGCVQRGWRQVRGMKVEPLVDYHAVPVQV